MNTRRVFAISMATLTLACPAPRAVADGTTCPNSITVTPIASNVDDGWDFVAGGGERPLERVGIYLGDPTEYGAQVPDSTSRIERKESVSWQIAATPADIYWIGCSYVGTTAMLFQRLDPAATACEAIYDLLPSGTRQGLKSLDCH